MSNWTHQNVMVLQYEPALKLSVWKDFAHRCRTRRGLIVMLRKEMKKGRYVAFRFIKIEEQSYGIPPIERKVKL